MDQFQEVQDMLGKLQRNESQMTATDLKKYEKPLRKLRNDIIEKVADLVKSFTLMSVRFAEGENKEVIDKICSNIQMIVDEVGAGGRPVEWRDYLFRTYDVNAYLSASVFLKDRIDYEAYVPYWCEHCKIRKMKPEQDPFGQHPEEWEAYWNDIIGMWWDPDSQLWIYPDRIGWTIKFRPTIEENEEDYKIKKGEYDEWWAEQHVAV